MTASRAKTKLAPVDDVPAENGDEPKPPSGANRAARRRAERSAAREQTADPIAQVQAQYQQLAEHANQVARDKLIAQRASDHAEALLDAARAQLEQLVETNQTLASQLAEVSAELDALYDAHPDLVPADE